MDLNKIGFAVINVALIVVLYMIYSIIKNKNKKQTHYSFLAVLTSLFIWTLGTVILEYYYMFTNEVSVVALNLAYIGLILSAPFVLFLGLVFAKSDRIKLSIKYISLLIVPIISIVMLTTNNMHHLFYKYIKYEELTSAAALGDYFTIHTIYSYGCILIGMALIVISSIKNTGLFSKQSILILLGILFTFVFNLLLTLQVINAYFYTNVIAIFGSLLLFFIAIFKFKFLNLIPIALQRVVNIISDGYVVLNEKKEVIDFNNAFISNFKVKQGDNFEQEIEQEVFSLDINKEEFNKGIEDARINSKTVTLNQKRLSKETEKYFDIEISAIFSQHEYRGTILLFKDITQKVKDMEFIKQSQTALIEQERLATLGQLAGSMAHDINTPLATISRAMSYFEKRIEETEDNKKMMEVTKLSIEKIGSIVNSVRDQIRNVGTAQNVNFSLEKVIKNVENLLFSELKKNNCVIEMTKNVDIFLTGDIGKLEQVIMNFVLNSIQAYDGKAGVVKINTYIEDGNAVIKISDNAGGIPKKIADGLFTQILTTKGSRGTGFGLYFSNSIIKGVFNGEITFDTIEGEGTDFHIKIPIK